MTAVKSGGGSGRSQGGKVRVATARKRKNSSNRWLERQLNDPYVKAAKAAGFRSRAAFKLAELDERFGLLQHVTRVVDLGAAPGGWCQIVLKARPKAVVVAIDLLPIEPLAGVTIFQQDILADDTEDLIRGALGGDADLVLSDMAANTVGHKMTDHLRTMGLVETGLAFAVDLLRPGGAFVAKVLAGGADPALVAGLKRHFAHVKHAKPPASRAGSSEWYVVAQGFKGRELPPPFADGMDAERQANSSPSGEVARRSRDGGGLPQLPLRRAEVRATSPGGGGMKEPVS